MIHIMVSFSDYQNSIFIDRVPCKQKKWQLHGILQISVQMSTFSPHMQKLLFQLKNVKNNHSSTRLTKKRHARSFSMRMDLI